MSLNKTLCSLTMLASLLTFSLSAINANAATYSVNETFKGTFTEEYLGRDIADTGSFIYNSSSLSFASLQSGDPDLFSFSLFSESTSFIDDLTQTLTCVANCNFTETLKNGDTIFGTLQFDGFNLPAPDLVFYSGIVTITGGTGLFAGATGTGRFTGLDDYSDMTETQTIEVTVTAVPEPETYAMLMAGLGLLGIFVKRRKSA